MTNQWLKRAGLKSETEGFLINAHDQAIKSNYYSSNCKILKDGTDQTQCAEFVVNFRKLLTILWYGALSWPKLNTYTDTIKPQRTLELTYIHTYFIVTYPKGLFKNKEMNIDTNQKWCEHEPQIVTEKDNITILWDMPVQTYREIKANRPDIVMKNKQEKNCLLIDVSIKLK